MQSDQTQSISIACMYIYMPSGVLRVRHPCSANPAHDDPHTHSSIAPGIYLYMRNRYAQRYMNHAVIK